LKKLVCRVARGSSVCGERVTIRQLQSELMRRKSFMLCLGILLARRALAASRHFTARPTAKKIARPIREGGKSPEPVAISAARYTTGRGSDRSQRNRRRCGTSTGATFALMAPSLRRARQTRKAAARSQQMEASGIPCRVAPPRRRPRPRRRPDPDPNPDAHT